jgi:hypothetical protein
MKCHLHCHLGTIVSIKQMIIISYWVIIAIIIHQQQLDINNTNTQDLSTMM